MIQERREFPRRRVLLRVTYTILNRSDATPCEYGVTVTEDLSERGACMLIEEQIEPNQLLYLNIQIPDRDRSLLMLAKSVAVVKDPVSGLYRVRCKFTGMLPSGIKAVIKELRAEIGLPATDPDEGVEDAAAD